jgi:hypothetical protein
MKSITSWLFSFLLILSFFPDAWARDSTSLNPHAIDELKVESSGGVPVGTIIAWPVVTDPPDCHK